MTFEPDKTWTEMTTAESVTDEVLEFALDEAEWRYPVPQTIDWDEIIDRLDGAILNDGSYLDLGGSYDSPAIRKIKKYVREARR